MSQPGENPLLATASDGIAMLAALWTSLLRIDADEGRMLGSSDVNLGIDAPSRPPAFLGCTRRRHLWARRAERGSDRGGAPFLRRRNAEARTRAMPMGAATRTAPGTGSQFMGEGARRSERGAHVRVRVSTAAAKTGSPTAVVDRCHGGRSRPTHLRDSTA